MKIGLLLKRMKKHFSLGSSGFFNLPTNLDILGLIFATVVFFCSFGRYSNEFIKMGIKSVEFLGIVCASVAIYLMWYYFKKRKKMDKGDGFNNFFPT